AHNGASGRGRRMAQRLGRALPGTIVTTSGGCAAHLAAELGSDRVRELSAWLSDGHGPDPDTLRPLTVDGRRARLGLQDSCHLRNALGVWREPRDLLARLGDYVEVPDAGSCCGAAGSYSVLRPADSRAVLEPKLDAIERLDLDYLVVVNPGCYRQVAQGLRRRRSATRVVHLAELLVARP
ncbi:MAG: (Fe-S)-binding protein, partial [Actinocatenispora sp.]